MAIHVAPNSICTVRVELLDSDPMIWREIEVPLDITLWDLSAIIQAAMNWENAHLWEFTIGKMKFGLPVPADEFYGMPPPIDGAAVILSSVLSPRRTTFRYLYDFGDGWEHRITVSRIRESEPEIVYPRLTGGERNAPPEDAGGLYGFYDKLAVVMDPSAPDPEDYRNWFGRYDPDVMNTKRIGRDLTRIAKALETARKRRRGR